MGGKPRKSYSRRAVDAHGVNHGSLWYVILECRHTLSKYKVTTRDEWVGKMFDCRRCREVDERIKDVELELFRLKAERFDPDKRILTGIDEVDKLLAPGIPAADISKVGL